MTETMERLGPTETTIETLNVWLEGDIAYETGKYTYRFKREGKDVTSSGKYVVVWKRQDNGGWKILRDIGLPD